MANANTPFGLKPVKNRTGANWNGKTRLCYVPSGSNSGGIFVGDPVALVNTGESTGHYAEVTKATAGATNKIFGVVTGIDQVLGQSAPNLNQNYLPASTGGWVYVTEDAGGDVIYEIQGSAYAALTASVIGLNADLVFNNNGNTITGLSGVEMDTGDSTAPSANATYQLTIVGGVDRPDNSPLLVNAKWLVVINLPAISPGIAGV